MSENIQEQEIVEEGFVWKTYEIFACGIIAAIVVIGMILSIWGFAGLVAVAAVLAILPSLGLSYLHSMKVRSFVDNLVGYYKPGDEEYDEDWVVEFSFHLLFVGPILMIFRDLLWKKVILGVWYFVLDIVFWLGLIFGPEVEGEANENITDVPDKIANDSDKEVADGVLSETEALERIKAKTGWTSDIPKMKKLWIVKHCQQGNLVVEEFILNFAKWIEGQDAGEFTALAKAFSNETA